MFNFHNEYEMELACFDCLLIKMDVLGAEFNAMIHN